MDQNKKFYEDCDSDVIWSDLFSSFGKNLGFSDLVKSLV